MRKKGEREEKKKKKKKMCVTCKERIHPIDDDRSNRLEPRSKVSKTKREFDSLLLLRLLSTFLREKERERGRR